MAKVELKKIYDISIAILTASGVPLEESKIIAETILDAHRKGRHTHGIGRLPIYVRKIHENLMSAKTNLQKIKKTPLISLYDAGNGFGQVAATIAMNDCINKAKVHGLAVSAVKDSNSFGTAGYYGEMAAKKGLIAIVMGNASPAMAPIGGSKAITGTNPICFAFPGTKKNYPVILDMACSIVARGKIRLCAKNGEKIPLDWAKDKTGNPTDDPTKAVEGTLNPIGGPKGFGLSLVADIFCGLLTGSAFAGDVKGLNDPKELSRYGHFMLCLNPEFFLTKDEYEIRMNYLIDKVKSCGDEGKIFMPGELEFLCEETNPVYVALSDTMLNDINSLAKTLEIDQRLQNQ
ncbi:MAG: Ldh family oxidoreductase [Lachnospiraceae bacterium]|nr:Ldh family oxidoreductase [Lachnospiraceae bacterium]